MRENMIQLENIVVRFGDFEALHSINVDVKEGEFFTFLGPSCVPLPALSTRYPALSG